MVFSCVRARMIFFDLWALWVVLECDTASARGGSGGKGGGKGFRRGGGGGKSAPGSSWRKASTWHDEPYLCCLLSVTVSGRPALSSQSENIAYLQYKFWEKVRNSILLSPRDETKSCQIFYYEANSQGTIIVKFSYLGVARVWVGGASCAWGTAGAYGKSAVQSPASSFRGSFAGEFQKLRRKNTCC